MSLLQDILSFLIQLSQNEGVTRDNHPIFVTRLAKIRVPDNHKAVYMMFNVVIGR